MHRGYASTNLTFSTGVTQEGMEEPYREGAYPALVGFEDRGPWSERKNVYTWVRNPSAFLAKNDYVRELRKKFGSTMTAFPDMTDEEIDAIIFYINTQSAQRVGIPMASN